MDMSANFLGKYYNCDENFRLRRLWRSVWQNKKSAIVTLW